MIIVDVQKCKSIEQALKIYKQKHNKIGVVQELRDRQTFTKPSIIIMNINIRRKNVVVL